MAIMIPSKIDRKATPGERLLFNTCENHLPDDWIVYYEPMIGSRKPDFVFIIPRLGILVLEAKDYKKSTIRSISPSRWYLTLPDGSEGSVRNPLDQARSYSFEISDKLKKDPVLLAGSESNRLKFSYGFGAVFSRLSRVDAVTMGLTDVIPDNLVLFREDIDPDSEDFDPDALFEMLSSMLSVRYSDMVPLTAVEVDRIRYHLFPEVRIGESKPYNENDLLKFRSLLSMSIYQESLSKQMGDGPRLLRGVSGSGKTLVMIARAKLLSRDNPKWKILILCYGVVLSRFIKSCISYKDYPNIEIMTFNEFMSIKFGAIREANIMSLSRSAEDGNELLPRYDSIFIDEVQDFEGYWLKLVSLCLSPETKSLMLCEDRAQSIFKRKTSLASTTGLSFQGRSRVLQVNYRNTKKVVTLAWNFFRKFSKESSSEEIIEPRHTMREGSDPMILGFNSFDQESSWVAGEILRLIRSGVSPSSIAVLYRVKKYRGVEYVDTLLNKFKGLSIPYSWVSEDRSSKSSYVAEDGKVKLLTLDSSKGLDFKAVFIITMHNSPLPVEEDLDRETSLVYIGITRSTESLYITYSGQSIFTKYFESKALAAQGNLNNAGGN